MAGGGGHSDAQGGTERHELLVLIVGQVGWRHGDGVVDVRHRRVGAALAVGRTSARETKVGEAGAGRDQTAEHPADGPEHSLGGEGSATVAKGIGEIQEDFSIPPDGEKHGTGRIQEKKTVPSAKINFKHFKFSTWIHDTVSLHHRHNVFRSGKGELPGDSTMVVGGDPAIDAGETLAAVDDGTTDGGSFFFHGPNGATEDLEGEVGFIEGAEQRTILELLLDVCVDISGGQAGGRKIEGGVARFWWRGEGNVPAEHEVFEEFRAVEVRPEGFLPRRYVE